MLTIPCPHCFYSFSVHYTIMETSGNYFKWLYDNNTITTQVPNWMRGKRIV